MDSPCNHDKKPAEGDSKGAGVISLYYARINHTAITPTKHMPGVFSVCANVTYPRAGRQTIRVKTGLITIPPPGHIIIVRTASDDYDVSPPFISANQATMEWPDEVVFKVTFRDHCAHGPAGGIPGQAIQRGDVVAYLCVVPVFCGELKKLDFSEVLSASKDHKDSK